MQGSIKMFINCLSVIAAEVKANNVAYPSLLDTSYLNMLTWWVAPLAPGFQTAVLLCCDKHCF